MLSCCERGLETIRQFLTSSALTLVLDLFFATVFLGVLYIYSPMLMLIVAATLPLYVVLSLGLTPAFRTRLNEKFKRYADNQAFLVEAVAGSRPSSRWRSSRCCSCAGKSSSLAM